MRLAIVTTKNLQGDFRSNRSKLPDEAFAYVEGPGHPPQDLVEEEIWHSVMGLPDDVILRTSDDHGSQLKVMHEIWGDWIESVGDTQDAMYHALLDAADDLQAALFNSLCGYYRVAASCLRSALELNALGTYHQLFSKVTDYAGWVKADQKKFGETCDLIYRHPQAQPLEEHLSKTRCSIFRQKSKIQEGGWARVLFSRLSEFAHARPSGSAAKMWGGSNGPIYVAESFLAVYGLYLETAALSYVLLKLARPDLSLPKPIKQIFGLKPPRSVALDAYEFLWGRF